MAQRVMCAVTVCIVLITIVYVVIYHQPDQSASVEVVRWPQPDLTASVTATDGQAEATRIPESSEEQPPSHKEDLRLSQPTKEELSPSLSKEEELSSEEEQGTKRIITNKSSKFFTKPFTTYLLIMVPILPKSFHSREMIRDTWYKGLNDSEDVMLRFAMGTGGLDDTNMTNALATENSTHGDLIYFDTLKESRTALTNKTLLLMQWAYSNVNYSYLLKCDDDTFVFVERMIEELKKRPSPTRLYYGLIQMKGKPHQSGTWKDTEWKLGDTYLPFALGGGYILSSDLIKLIIENIDYLQWHPNEDTAVGSWLAPYKIELRNDKLICMSTFKWNTNCQKYLIMHLFYGIEQSKLDEIFYNYAKERYSLS